VWREARTSSSTVRSENTPKVRFSATLGQEPEVEVGGWFSYQLFVPFTELAQEDFSEVGSINRVKQ
jgi:hypothetical protein